MTDHYDVIVVGSGAGGGVIAGELTAAGQDVVVLEAGGYFNESDFNQLELWAYQNLYRGGGVTSTASGSVALMAGSTASPWRCSTMSAAPSPRPRQTSK